MLFLCWGKRGSCNIEFIYYLLYIFVKNHILNMFTVKTGISLRSASPWVVRPKIKKKKKEEEEEESSNCGTTFL